MALCYPPIIHAREKRLLPAPAKPAFFLGGFFEKDVAVRGLQGARVWSCGFVGFFGHCGVDEMPFAPRGCYGAVN